MTEQTTLRGALESAFDNVDTGAIETTTTERTVEALRTEAPPVETAEEKRARDEQGRFARQEALEAKAPAAPVAPPVPPPVDEIQKPTTWKKEYLPMWDKLAAGQPLTVEEAKAFLKYQNQRETEYKTGVSTYKQEAERARELHGAIEPFMPLLQQHNINPSQWIGNLGRAHQALALGTPEQKLQVFAKLAQDYGVPLQAVGSVSQGQEIDPNVMGLMQQIQQLQGQVKTVASWREKEEQGRTAQAIAELQNDAENYPHFEEAKPMMAQLLESGLAQDLKTAYAKAIRMDDAIWQKEQARQSQAAQSQAEQRAAVAKAKAAAVSVKTATPSGTNAGAGAKDRRSILSEQLDAAGGRV